MAGSKRNTKDAAVGWIATVDALLLFLLLNFVVIMTAVQELKRSVLAEARSVESAVDTQSEVERLLAQVGRLSTEAEIATTTIESKSIEFEKTQAALTESKQRAQAATAAAMRERKAAELEVSTLKQLSQTQRDLLGKATERARLAADELKDKQEQLQLLIPQRDQLVLDLKTAVATIDELRTLQLDRRGQEAIHQELLGVGGKLRKVAFLMDCSNSMGRQQNDPVWSDAVEIFNTWIKYLPVEEAVLIAFANDVATYPQQRQLLPISTNGKPILLKQLGLEQRPTAAQFSVSQRLKLAEKRAFEDDRSTRDFLASWLETAEVKGWTATRKALETAFSYPEIDTIILFTDGQPTDAAFAQTRKERDEILTYVKNANAERSTPIVINVVALGEFHVFNYVNLKELTPLWTEFSAPIKNEGRTEEEKQKEIDSRKLRSPMIEFLTELASENNGFFCARRPVPTSKSPPKASR